MKGRTSSRPTRFVQSSTKRRSSGLPATSASGWTPQRRLSAAHLTHGSRRWRRRRGRRSPTSFAQFSKNYLPREHAFATCVASATQPIARARSLRQADPRLQQRACGLGAGVALRGRFCPPTSCTPSDRCAERRGSCDCRAGLYRRGRSLNNTATRNLDHLAALTLYPNSGAAVRHYPARGARLRPRARYASHTYTSPYERIQLDMPPLPTRGHYY